MARTLGVSLAAAAVLVTAVLAVRTADPATDPAVGAGRDFSKVSRYVFVPSRSAPIVTVIDRDSDRVAGTLNSGLAPDQVVVSEPLAKLIAIDGNSPRVSIVDLADGRLSGIDLDFTPSRLVGSADGYMVAVADVSAGTVAFIQLLSVREVSRVTGLTSIRDLLFGSDAAFLYVAAEGLGGVGVVDVARGKLISQIAIPNVRGGDITGLTRAPNGRTGYAKARGAGTVGLFDLGQFRPIRQLEVGRDVAKAYPTGFGGYLLAPDNSEKTVTIINNTSLTTAAMLKGAAEMTTIYSGWFDTIALVPSSAERKLLVYDLDRLARAPDIPLPGKPGLGAVTSDGAKLYLALEDASQVAVINLQTRQLVKTIPVGPGPVAAILGKSFDVCH